MIRLRPHHILCIENFKGEGYDNRFIKNMYSIIYDLKSKDNEKIKIVFGKDSICEKCPNKTISNLCLTQEKVQDIDNKMIKIFNLKQKVYKYNELLCYIKNNMTLEKFNYICNECEWRKKGICSKKVFENL